jgi:transcriptional regulator with XRE-family HTH domain
MDKQQQPELVGSRFCALREQQGLSAEKLARRADMGTRNVWRLEANERPNSAAIVVARVALALNTSVEYLVGLTDDPRPPHGLRQEQSWQRRLQAQLAGEVLIERLQQAFPVDWKIQIDGADGTFRMAVRYAGLHVYQEAPARFAAKLRTPSFEVASGSFSDAFDDPVEAVRLTLKKAGEIAESMIQTVSRIERAERST